jgi:hypothetical protein
MTKAISNQPSDTATTKAKHDELNRIAAASANVLMAAAFEKHRGRAYAGNGVHILFGNDDYAKDERARAEAHDAMQCADELGLRRGEVQTSESEGYTWALAVECDEADAEEICASMCAT